MYTVITGHVLEVIPNNFYALIVNFSTQSRWVVSCGSVKYHEKLFFLLDSQGKDYDILGKIRERFSWNAYVRRSCSSLKFDTFTFIDQDASHDEITEQHTVAENTFILDIINYLDFFRYYLHH